MDVEMASWKSTGTYVDEVPPLGANIVDGMWIFRVKRPPGSPPTFKARYIARGFSQREGVDYFQTFSPTPKMTTLWVLLHVAAERDYELHSLDFSTAFLQGSLHEEIWLRRPPGFTRTFPAGTQWSLRRPVYGLRQAPRKWHDTLRTTLAALGFAPSTADPSLTTGMGLVVGGRGPVVLTGHADASWVDDSSTQLLSQVYTFILGSGSVSLRSTRSSSVLNSSCEAEIYAGAMAAQELRLLTYLLTDLGEQPRSPPVVYVDNKAMIALCQEHRLEHRTKHIARRYFLARELQQRGQLRLAYMATRANTADVFTKALPPACFAFLDCSCDHLFSPTLPMGLRQLFLSCTDGIHVLVCGFADGAHAADTLTAQGATKPPDGAAKGRRQPRVPRLIRDVIADSGESEQDASRARIGDPAGHCALQLRVRTAAHADDVGSTNRAHPTVSALEYAPNGVAVGTNPEAGEAPASKIDMSQLGVSDLVLADCPLDLQAELRTMVKARHGGKRGI
ncbi:unnamed protein product [Closterium sp. NIES-53]